MRRSLIVAAVLVLVFVGIATGRLSSIGAQEATPAPEEFAPPEGVSFEPLAVALGVPLPPSPGDVVLARFGLEPGAGFPIGPDDPQLVVVYVEEGTFTFRMEDPVRVTRAAAMAEVMATLATPGAEPPLPEPEEVAAGTEFTLGAGDSAVFEPGHTGEVRNDGGERAVAIVVFVSPPETATPAAATPVATPAA